MSRAADLRLFERTGALVAQLFFIAAGVYLGNRADDWKQEKSHREAERATLQNFRAEMVANRENVRQHAAIHARYADSMMVSERRGDSAPRSVREVFRRLGWQGIAPIRFSHTAWDLALATQSLSYIPPQLAFGIARVYTEQNYVERIGADAGVALLSPAGMSDVQVYPWLTAFAGYIGDMQYNEPTLIAAYDAMLPRIDSALAAGRR